MAFDLNRKPLTVEELAKSLGVSTRTVQRRAAKLDIKPIKRDGKSYYDARAAVLISGKDPFVLIFDLVADMQLELKQIDKKYSEELNDLYVKTRAKTRTVDYKKLAATNAKYLGQWLSKQGFRGVALVERQNASHKSK